MRRTGSSRSKDPDSPAVKGRVGEGAAGYVISFCTIFRCAGIKVNFQASSAFWFQPVWDLYACGQQFSSGGGLIPVKTA